MASSSDAIPVHLLTVEAIEVLPSSQRRRALIFNVTNRYIRMAPVFADAAKHLNLVLGTRRRLRPQGSLIIS